MISIITASYNYANYIKECIDSVLSQDFTDWELIIVDDGSVDNSVEIIKSYTDSRIRLIRNEKNSGLKQTLLRGIQEAGGEYIAFLESDDIWRTDYLSKKEPPPPAPGAAGGPEPPRFAQKAAGLSATKKVSITPIEEDMLEVFRKVGKKHGESAQQAIITVAEKML